MSKKLFPTFVIVFACMAFASAVQAQVTYTTGAANWNNGSAQGNANDFDFTGGVGLWSADGNAAWGVVAYRNLTTDGTLNGAALSLQVGQSLSITLSGADSSGRTGVSDNGAIGFSLAGATGAPSGGDTAAQAIDASRFRLEFVGGDSSAEYVGASTVSSGMPGFADFKSGQTYIIEMISTNQINFRIAGGTAYNIIDLGGTSNAGIGRIELYSRGSNMDARFTGLVVSNMSSISLSNNTGESSTISGIIAKNNGANNNIAKSGDGEVILTAANTFGGTVAVNNGTLRIANSSALGGSGSVTVASGGTLALSNEITEDNALNISGTGEGGVGAIRNVSGNNTLTGAVTLGAAASVKSESGTTTTFSGGFGGTGNGLTVNGDGSTIISTTGINTGSAGTLTKNDAGTLLVSASGNYTGATTVNGGTLAVSVNNALGTIGAGTTIASGATLDFRNINYSTAEAVTNNGGTIATTTGTSTIAGGVTLGANSTYNVSGTQLTQSGAITDGNGTFGITKNGGGVLVLGSANSYDGTTELNAGTIRLAAGASLGSGNVVIGPNGSSGNATLNIGDADGGTTLANNIIIRAGGGTRTVGAENTAGTNTFSGAMFLDGDLTLAAATGGSLNLSGKLDDGLGSGGYAVTIGGSGRVVFSGATNNVNITGYTVNNGATLLMNKSSADAVQSTLTVNSGGTAEFGASDQLGSGANIVNNGTLATGTDGITDSFNSLVSSGNITGNGTLTASTYSLSGGTVDANLGGGTLNITGNAALNGTSGANTVAITGGSLTLGNSSNRLSSSADVTISVNHSLNIAGNQTLASIKETAKDNGGTVSIASGATLTINGNNKGTLFQNTISGDGSLTLAASGNTVLSLYNTGGAINLGGTFTISGGELGGSSTLTAANYALNGGTVTANLGVGTATASSGETALGGTLGATTVNVSGGTLNLGANDRLANGATVNVSSGTLGMGVRTDTVTTLNMSGGSVTGSTGNKLTATTYNLSGGTVGANLGAGTLNANSGEATLNGTADATTVNVGGGSLGLGSAGRLTSGAAVIVSNSGTLTLGGNETVTSLALTGGTLGGSGTLTASTYALNGGAVNAALGAGAVTVATGTTALGSAGRLNSASTLTVNSGQLTLGGNETVASLAGSGGTIALGNSSLTVGGNSYSNSFAGLISGNGSLIKSGTGTLTLSGSNSYTGGTMLEGGTLDADNGNGFGTGSVTVGLNTILDLLSHNVANQIVNNGGTVLSSGVLSDVDAEAGETTIGGDGSAVTQAAGTATVNVTANDVTVASVDGSAQVNVGGTGAQVGTVSGGTVTLSNSATGSRVTTASAGTVNANAAGVIVGTISNTAIVNVGGTNGRVATLAGGTVNANAAGLVITNKTGGNLAISNGVTVGLRSGNSSGVISGAGGIAKQGATTLTLAGVNTYSGATTVEEGKLVVSGSISSDTTVQSGATIDINGTVSGSLLVDSGGTVSGSGTISGPATLASGATISPGNSPGTQSYTSGFAWSGGANYNWQIYNATGTAGNPNGWDLIAVSGGDWDITGLSSENKFNINLWSLSGISPDVNGAALNFDNTLERSWTILTYTTLNGTFDASLFAINTGSFNGTAGFANDLGSGLFKIALDAETQSLNLLFDPTGGVGPEAIPEPGTWAAAALLAGAAGYVRWRRRKEQPKDA